jgi:hypothetical protein
VPFRPTNTSDDVEELVEETFGQKKAKLDDSQYRPTRDELVKRLFKLIDPPETYDEISDETSFLRLQHWQTSGFYGALAVLLPNLEELSLSAHSEEIVGTQSYYSQRKDLFALIMDGKANDDIRGRLLLKKVRCMAGYIEQNTVLQPGLESLVIGANARLHISRLLGTIQPILTSIELVLSAEEILYYHIHRGPMQPVELHPVMLGLRRMKLLIEDTGPRSFAFDDLNIILPPTLRKLNLLHRGKVELGDLERITDHYIAHRSLRRFYLYCAPDDDVVLSDGPWSVFKEHGMSVYVWAISGIRLLKGMPTG